MCLAIPAKVIEVIDDNTVLVVSRKAKIKVSSVLVDNIKPEDYVLIHAGFIIEKIDAAFAEELLSFHGEILDEE